MFILSLMARCSCLAAGFISLLAKDIRVTVNIATTRPLSRGRRKALCREEWLVGFGLDHPRLGKQAIPLQPENVENLAGRFGFYIHGDNSRGDFSASTSCIILGRSVRDCIDHLSRWSGIRRLVVR